ncbi:hypothetical protein [Demequina sp. NBRC 110051]|uniref:hypothetical protein n=1 Tax=Demequina sp. NBRC 110051 TaxID=1570340 RepID=UPI00117C7415|nr:hypothetical protein [Demequina sp. NBRC 110051]
MSGIGVAAFVLASAAVFHQPFVATELPQCERSATVGDWGADTCGSQVDAYVAIDDGGSVDEGTTQIGSRPKFRYQRHEVCLEWLSGGVDRGDEELIVQGPLTDCTAGTSAPPLNTCAPGETVRPPLFRSELQDDGSYGPWIRMGSYGCDTDALYAAAIDAWRSMDITPSGYEIQPDAGYAISSLGIVPIAEGGPQTRTVTLLGANVQLRATPQNFTWSTSDGDSWTTTSPGTTYANGGEPYLFDPGERRIQLTLATEWTGEFSLNGGSTWIDAPGTATTTSDTTSIHIYSPRSRLVDCDLNGNCGSNQSATSADAPTVLDPDGDGIDNYTVSDAQIADYLAARER